ncbi:MAG TPA: BON domain-containing protein [Bryobacteraceae bacterium]|nr:BON domain-containing protein [Bryobacteraceae bacterium]
MKRKLQMIPLVVALAAFTSPMFARYQAKDLSDAVRHELVSLPYYNIFDNLEYRVDPSGVVTLSGQVTWPVLKSDAEHSVRKIPGVTQVVNNIEVLPLSPMDNQIRRAEYQAIFGFGPLYRYAMGANPSIHIIVDNGHVTLIGVVDSQADKNMANIRANGVPGVFSVTNDLRVAEKG